MNIFKKLFGSQTTSKETKQEENKNFDVLKYDGVRALRMQQFEYAAKCFVHAIELNADDLDLGKGLHALHETIAAIDAGALRPPLLADPLGAVRLVSRDPACETPLELMDGRRLTAIEIQREYHAQLTAAGCGDAEVNALWERTLDRLVDDPLTCTELDWVAKLTLMESFRRRDGLGWDHPRLAQLDVAWADLDGRASPYAALVRAGRMPRLTTDAEVERAATEPPDDTRAYLRGRLVAERTSEVLGIDWSWILLQTRQGRRRLRLDDPLGGAAADVAASGGLDGLIATL